MARTLTDAQLDEITAVIDRVKTDDRNLDTDQYVAMICDIVAPAPLIESISTSADGFGRWHAKIEFSRTLSESDLRPEFNLAHQWGRLRAQARSAIVSEIADREQKRTETRFAAEKRIRASLPRLVVAKQSIDSMNCWHGVTFGEPA